ncbi:MAG: helix-turn-helix domain-containing protein [Bacteroidota bacterium]
MSNFLNIIILLGTLQGIITSVLLFRLKINKKANKLLASIILLISLACLNIYFLETVRTDSILWAILEAIIPLVIVMPVGPLIYFYVKSLLNPEFRLHKKDRSHFYTILLDLIPYLAALIFIVGGYFGWINSDSNEQWGNFIDTYNVYIDIPRWISLSVYTFLALKLISRLEKNSVITIWAKRFSIGFTLFAVIWLLHLVPYVTPAFSNTLLDAVGWYPVYIPLIVLVYWLGINGYIISFNTYRQTANRKDISEETVKKTTMVLEQLMRDDQLYLNPSLKLNDVVKLTEIPQKTISAVLNQYIGKTFNEYINTFRIEEFKQRLLDKDSNHLTITGIALECGFNSQATFQRTFKAMTNLSPKEFQQKHLKR